MDKVYVVSMITDDGHVNFGIYSSYANAEKGIAEEKDWRRKHNMVQRHFYISTWVVDHNLGD